MKNFLTAGFAGLIFGIGLHLSGMSNPAKVLNFLDLFGSFDPSLILVMGGALAITAIGYRLVWQRSAPLFDSAFHVPTNTLIDRQLLGGAVLFGMGWGLVGICPGPALSALLLGSWPIWLFVVAMLVGMGVAPTAKRLLKLAQA